MPRPMFRLWSRRMQSGPKFRSTGRKLTGSRKRTRSSTRRLLSFTTTRRSIGTRISRSRKSGTWRYTARSRPVLSTSKKRASRYHRNSKMELLWISELLAWLGTQIWMTMRWASQSQGWRSRISTRTSVQAQTNSTRRSWRSWRKSLWVVIFTKISSSTWSTRTRGCHSF